LWVLREREREMERDFLGLSSNNVSKMVKEEANGNDDSVKSGMAVMFPFQVCPFWCLL
jgi:hypothetical protein